jgi:hypothetical protein
MIPGSNPGDRTIKYYIYVVGIITDENIWINFVYVALELLNVHRMGNSLKDKFVY